MENIDGEENKHGYLILATDNMILATNSKRASTRLENYVFLVNPNIF